MVAHGLQACKKMYIPFVILTHGACQMYKFYYNNSEANFSPTPIDLRMAYESLRSEVGIFHADITRPTPPPVYLQTFAHECRLNIHGISKCVGL